MSIQQKAIRLVNHLLGESDSVDRVKIFHLWSQGESIEIRPFDETLSPDGWFLYTMPYSRRGAHETTLLHIEPPDPFSPDDIMMSAQGYAFSDISGDSSDHPIIGEIEAAFKKAGWESELDSERPAGELIHITKEQALQTYRDRNK